jgi:hypothetical protein
MAANSSSGDEWYVQVGLSCSQVRDSYVHRRKPPTGRMRLPACADSNRNLPDWLQLEQKCTQRGAEGPSPK